MPPERSVCTVGFSTDGQWGILDDLREYWLQHGHFQLHGARAFITPSGTIYLARGRWRATIAQ